MPRVALALTIAFFALVVQPAVAQNATRDQALAEVHIEPKDDPCLNEAVVRARVAKRLARDAELSNVEVVVHAEDPPRLTVLRAGQVVAERRFEDFPARCNARRDAIAVAVALALERAPGPAPSTTSATSTTEPTPSTTEPAASTPSPAPSATSPTPSAAVQPAAPAGDAGQDEPNDDTTGDSKLGAHAGALAVLEILPGLAFAGVLGVDIGLPFAGLRVSLSAVASLPQEDDALGATVRSQLLLGRLLGCTDLTASELALEGCGGLLAGAVFAEGLGYASSRSTELGYAAVLARVALRYPADALISARIALDGLLPVVRPSYAVREQPGPGLAKVTPAPIGAALGLEVVLALP